VKHNRAAVICSYNLGGKKMQTALIIIHVIISIVLIAVVLLQHGKQQGLSGAIAGGAETFFGKNKGRTIDAVLKKVTAVVAFLFIVSSIVLATYSISKDKAEAEALNEAVQQQVETQAETEAETEAAAE
jgi:preprotein translocase subunit SecG